MKRDLKHFIKKIIPRRCLNLLRSLIVPERLFLMDKDLKSLFLAHYQSLGENIYQRDDLRNHEFRIYSKVGEDGLIAYIFSRIGTTNRRFVELGIQDGKECNTANLSLNFGWHGLLVDAQEKFVAKAQYYYQKMLEKRASSVKIVQCLLTAENINKTLLDNGLRGEIDLLSIDIDGNDYWVWKAITAVNPRVAVIEYNASFGFDKSIAIKYSSDFYYPKNYRKSPLYFGASLPALAKLSREKGYILVGCDSQGHDAFFVRKDVADGKFQELSAEDAFYPSPYLIKTIGSTEKQFDQIKHLEFDYV